MRQRPHTRSHARRARSSPLRRGVAVAMPSSRPATGRHGRARLDRHPPTERPPVGDVVAGQPFPDDRCAANHDAGTISYLTGFDYAAAASMIDVFVAAERGYYDDLCLDVEMHAELLHRPTTRIVAAGQAAVRLRRLVHRGRRRSPSRTRPTSSRSWSRDARRPTCSSSSRTRRRRLTTSPATTIGVKGKIPPSIAAMLAGAGLVEGRDYQTVLLDGFDPMAHIAPRRDRRVPRLPQQRTGHARAGRHPVRRLRPDRRTACPDRSACIYTTRSFIDDHPTAAQDFVRATMRGLGDAIADPDAAAADRDWTSSTAGGNPNFLSPEGETFRWSDRVGDAASRLRRRRRVVRRTRSRACCRPRSTRTTPSGCSPTPARTRRPTSPRSIDTAPIDAVYGARNVVIWPA